MVGWHVRLNGHEFEQALGDGELQGSLVCCSPWGCKELDMTEQLNRLVPNRKRVRQGCILSSCLFNLYAEYIMRNTGLEEAQAGIKISGRNIKNLRYADDTTLMAESERN